MIAPRMPVDRRGRDAGEDWTGGEARMGKEEANQLTQHLSNPERPEPKTRLFHSGEGTSTTMKVNLVHSLHVTGRNLVRRT